jgi:hypothetical protein
MHTYTNRQNSLEPQLPPSLILKHLITPRHTEKLLHIVYVASPMLMKYLRTRLNIQKRKVKQQHMGIRSHIRKLVHIVHVVIPMLMKHTRIQLIIPTHTRKLVHIVHVVIPMLMKYIKIHLIVQTHKVK